MLQRVAAYFSLLQLTFENVHNARRWDVEMLGRYLFLIFITYILFRKVSPLLNLMSQAHESVQMSQLAMGWLRLVGSIKL